MKFGHNSAPYYLCDCKNLRDECSLTVKAFVNSGPVPILNDLSLLPRISMVLPLSGKCLCCPLWTWSVSLKEDGRLGRVENWSYTNPLYIKHAIWDQDQLQERSKGSRQLGFAAKTDPRPRQHLYEELKLRLQDIPRARKGTGLGNPEWRHMQESERWAFNCHQGTERSGR